MFLSVHRPSVGQVEQHLSTSFIILSSISEKKASCAGRGGSAPVAIPTSFLGFFVSPPEQKGASVRRRKTLGMRLSPDPVPSHRE